MSETADVVVIGGGCNGASIAFHLAAGKAGRVVLLEKGALASGPTGRSTAIVRQHYSNQVTARMALDSLRVFQQWEDRVGGTCGFVRTGFLVGVRGGDRTALEGNVALQRGVGIDVRLVGADELRRLEPQLFAEDLVAGAYEPEAGYCDPVSTTTSFAEAARGRGARIVQGREATAIRIERGRVAGVETAAGSVAAPVVVVAAGPWARRLVDGVGVARQVVDEPDLDGLALAPDGGRGEQRGDGDDGERAHPCHVYPPGGGESRRRPGWLPDDGVVVLPADQPAGAEAVGAEELQGRVPAPLGDEARHQGAHGRRELEAVA